MLLIALIQNGMVLAKVDPYWVQFLLGALILAAVCLNRWRARRSGGRRLTAMVAVDNVTKYFPGVRALDDVSSASGPARSTR